MHRVLQHLRLYFLMDEVILADRHSCPVGLGNVITWTAASIFPAICERFCTSWSAERFVERRC